MARVKKVLSVSLSPVVIEALARYCAIRGNSRSSAIEELLLYALRPDDCAADHGQLDHALGRLRERSTGTP